MTEPKQSLPAPKLTRFAGSNFELQGDKRQYLPYKLDWRCPKCKSSQKQDFTDQYLSYPDLSGKPINHTLYCNDCDAETPIVLKLELQLQIVQ